MERVVHLALPIRVVGRAYAVRDQDSDAEVADAVSVILSYERGERIEDPDFGIDDPTFETQPIDTQQIEMAIRDYEPRALVDVSTNDQPDGTTTVTVKVTQPTSDDLPVEE